MADDKDAEFAFDLFSDIAPLLALFGDQFARQFTSESLTWVDHLIFAMVPLGTLIVITGAIRVQGPRIAKSFIGRGRESRALAEIELMSSTSGEVFELFNSKSIIRDDGEAQDRPDTGIPSASSRPAASVQKQATENFPSSPDSLKGSHEVTEKECSRLAVEYEDASCQQLLRVWQRLGDLTEWSFRSLQSAQSVAYCAEKFIEEFLPKHVDHLVWIVETAGYQFSGQFSEQSDHVNIAIQRKMKGKWQVDIGKSDASLSLSKASIEAQAVATRKRKRKGKKTKEHESDANTIQSHNKADWRRAKAGIGLGCDYCRILGDDFEDGVLKRDISWWVDELTADQNDPGIGPKEPLLSTSQVTTKTTGSSSISKKSEVTHP